MDEMGIPIIVLFAVGLLSTGLVHSQEPKEISDKLYLALELERGGDRKGAERLLLRLLESEQKTPTAAVVLNNLAVLYMSMERFSDAERYYRQSIAILAAGSNKERWAQANLGLANLYLKMGRIEEARRLASPGFIGDANQPQTQALLANLAFHKKDFATAERLYSQVFRTLLGMGNGTPGDEIPTKVATVLNNLAMVALKQGRIADAHLRMAFSVLIWKLLTGPDSLTVAKVMNNFGAICMEAKLYRHAENFFFQTSKIVGKGTPSRLSFRVQLAHAAALKKLGRKVEARLMQKQAEATRKTLHAIDYRDLRDER
jgi:tetratricopeptide (TPR) repeat protein